LEEMIVIFSGFTTWRAGRWS